MGGEQVNPGSENFASQFPDNWYTQPNCQRFGFNLDDNYRHARFGFQANQENDCNSHDTMAGFGLGDESNENIGSGDFCSSTECRKGYARTGSDTNTNNQY